MFDTGRIWVYLRMSGRSWVGLLVVVLLLALLVLLVLLLQKPRRS